MQISARAHERAHRPLGRAARPPALTPIPIRSRLLPDWPGDPSCTRLARHSPSSWPRSCPRRPPRSPRSARRCPTSTSGTSPTCIRPRRPGRRPRTSVARRIPELAAYDGHVGESAEALQKALVADVRDVDRESDAARTSTRPPARGRGHARVSHSPARCSRPRSSWAVDFRAAATSFVARRSSALDPAGSTSSVAAGAAAQRVPLYLEDILRWKPHTLSAARGEDRRPGREPHRRRPVAPTTSSRTRDLPYPEVTLSTGEKVRLDAAAYHALPRLARPRRPRRGVRRRSSSAYRRVRAHHRHHPRRAGQDARLREGRPQASELRSRRRCSTIDIPTLVYRAAHRRTCTRTCRRCTATSSCGSA